LRRKHIAPEACGSAPHGPRRWEKIYVPEAHLPGKEFFKIRTWKPVALEELSDKFCQKEEVARPT
jgi:hypothetical protein